MPDQHDRQIAEPPRRYITDHHDAEAFVAEWMHWAGYAGSSATQATADGGVDVVSREAVAQVKFGTRATGRPALQALYGAAIAARRKPLFFSAGGFTAQAVAWATPVHMALFTFDTSGEVHPLNPEAEAVVREAKGLPPRPTWSWLHKVIAAVVLVWIAFFAVVGYSEGGFVGLWVGAMIGGVIAIPILKLLPQ